MAFIGIVGSRPPRFSGQELVWKDLVDDLELWLDEHVSFEDTIVSGMAPGVDTLAEEWAKKNKISYLIFPPKTPTWSSYHARNIQIVKASDIVHAWPSPWSRGTYDTIDIAKASNKLGRVYGATGPIRID